MSDNATAVKQTSYDHMNTLQLIKFVLPTIVTVVFASLYGIIDGIFISNVGGNTAFAAINLITPLFLIFSSFGMMFGTGGNALVSKTRGEGDTVELKYLLRKSLIILAVVSVAMTLLGEAMSHPIAQIFSAGNEDLVKMTVVGFEIYGISFLFKGFNTFGSAFFTALNNGLVSGVLAVLRALVFSIGTVLILPIIFYIQYGADTALLGIWWSVNYSEFLALLVTIFFLVKNRKKYHY